LNRFLPAALRLTLSVGILATAAGCNDPSEGPATPVDAVVDSVSADTGGDATADGTVDAEPELPVVVEPTAPPDMELTINELPGHMNGSLPLPNGNPYAVWVNRENFTLDLMSKASEEIDWSTLSLTCTHTMVMPDGTTVDAGESLASHVAPHPLGADTTGVARRVHFTTDVGVEEGLQVICQASVSNSLGEASSNVSFVVATLEPGYDPFVEPDVWLVTLSRDIFDTTFTDSGDGTIAVTSEHVAEGDGELDFDEAFVGLGFFSTTNMTVRAAMKERILTAIRSQAYRIFQLDENGDPTSEGVPLKLVFEGDPDAPDPATFTEDGTLSLIALGGDGPPVDQANGLVGRADLDWNNQVANDNTVYDRGVYPSGIARSVLAQPLGVLAIRDLLPGRGVPVGDHPEDDTLFAPGFNPNTITGDLRHRYDLVEFAVDMLALAIASTLCHEIGHSLGLVPPGPPPGGMFAGMPKLDFIDNFIDSAHIDTAGLNVMQTGKVTNYIEAVSQVPDFNPLNMAYLRRRVVVLANP